MLRTGLIAVLLLGLGSTAMAHDRERVRVFVGVDSYYGDVSYGISYVGGGRDYGRWDGRHRHYYDRGGYWRYGRYYSAPRGYYYYPKPYYYRPHYGPRYGYSRGYHGGRHWHDRRHDGRHGGRRWHRH